MEKLMTLQYSSALSDIVEANPSFDVGKLRIAYTGKNRNNSFISKEAFEAAIPTMYGCPIVVNYDIESDQIGSHDGELIRKQNGDIVYVNLTEPIGFVPHGANWQWDILEDNGEMHQYLTTEVLLWKRQAAYSKIKENNITDQSMEITVTDGEMRDDYYKISSFYFTAFCLLGNAEPCFESAALFSFEKDSMQKQLNEMVEDFKLSFANDSRFAAKEGDVFSMSKLDELLEKYSVTMDDLDFDVEGLSDEELEEKFEEQFGDLPDDDDDKFALNSNISAELRKYISEIEKIHEEWGDFARYWFIDYSHDLSEVYFEDSEDCSLWGAPYKMDGDNIIVEIENKKRKKYTIVDFDEGQAESVNNFVHVDYLNTVKDLMNTHHNEKYSELQGRYDTLTNSVNEKETKELFDRFEDKLGGTPEFEAIKKETSISAEELEIKLYAMLGRKQFSKANATKTAKSPKAPVIQHDADSDDRPYGDLFNY